MSHLVFLLFFFTRLFNENNPVLAAATLFQKNEKLK